MLLFRGQLRAPNRGLLTAEAAACAALMSAPFQAFTANCMASLRVLGAGFAIPAATSTMQAASTRVALTLPLLAQRLTDLDNLAKSDEAMIYPDRPLWMRTGTLATLRAALSHANDLPPEIREHSRPQSRSLRLMADAEAEGHIRNFLTRRVRYFVRRDSPAGEIAFLYDGLRTVFRVLPSCVGMAVLRAVANAWTTSRRMSHGATRCLWGCCAVGGDGLQHYVSCPLLARFAQHPRLQPPRWAGNGHMQIVLMVLPLSEFDTCVSAVWMYLAHLLHAGARRDSRIWDASFFETSARAVGRSTVTSLPTVRPFIVRDAA